MDIEKKKQGETLILKLKGRLDTDTAPMLQEVVDTETEGVKELQIDMELLEFVSSAGLRVLLAASKKMHGQRGTMPVYHVNDEVKEVFLITGFHRILDIQ